MSVAVCAVSNRERRGEEKGREEMKTKNRRKGEGGVSPTVRLLYPSEVLHYRAVCVRTTLNPLSEIC
jgi:hypothetical protein